METRIKYVKGDATEPQGDGKKIITHICNDIGAWGQGFVMALSRKWREPEAEYREWHRSRDGFELGKVQFVEVEPDIIVANIIGQHGIIAKDSIPPIRYKALEKGLKKVAKKAGSIDAEIHMPRIGSGLAGGKWKEIEKIIYRTLTKEDIPVTVYDLS